MDEEGEGVGDGDRLGKEKEQGEDAEEDSEEAVEGEAISIAMLPWQLAQPSTH